MADACLLAAAASPKPGSNARGEKEGEERRGAAARVLWACGLVSGLGEDGFEILLYAVAVGLPPSLGAGVGSLVDLCAVSGRARWVETGERPGRGGGPVADEWWRWGWSISTVCLFIGRLQGPFPVFF